MPLTDAQYMAKLQARIRLTDNGCWEVTDGWRSREGYAHMNYRNRLWKTHRLMWFLTHGSIPDQRDLVVCHTCDNPPCCNPDHLWLGTRLQNIQDATGKGRHRGQRTTHCPRGHAYDSENTRVTAAGGRVCLTCTRARQRLLAGWPEHLAYSVPPVPANAETERRKFGKKLRNTG